MITVNASFFRRERRRRGHFQTYWKNLERVELDLASSDDHAHICAALHALLPPVQGWILSSYCLIAPGREPIPVKVF